VSLFKKEEAGAAPVARGALTTPGRRHAGAYRVLLPRQPSKWVGLK